VCLLSLPLGCFAQVSAGTVEGRVRNTRNGDYVENARVTIVGTQLETFTDSAGQYRFSGLPAGAVGVRAFFTGLLPLTRTVTVVAGQGAQQDFDLVDADARPAANEGAVKLDQFVVSTSKEMDGAAIAINEQRFSSRIVNVVAADEFGFMAEGSVGEFLKYLPGMAVDYAGGDARTISMGGVPAGYVPITINGFGLASAASSSTARTVELDQFSMANNIARVEVYHSPTPESPGSALAGGVNLVPRSAFERSRPVFTGNAYVMMRDDTLTLSKTPGPMNRPTRKIHPGFDFSYVVPVNQRFGFTVSGGTTRQFTNQATVNRTWRGAGNPTTVAATATNGLPDTTPDKPYLTNFSVIDGARETSRTSAGLTMDYKISPNDRLSFAFQYAYFDAIFNNRNLIFNITRVQPGQFSTTFTRGDAGFGDITIGSQDSRRKSGTTYMPTLVWRHTGPVWKMEAGSGYSHSSNYYVSIDKGFFNAATARRTGLTIAFDDISYLRPGRITVTDGTTGAPVDPYRLDNYSLVSATDSSNVASDLKRSVFGNARRDFLVGSSPVSLKAGFDVGHVQRDVRGSAPSFVFVGADRRATTTPTNPAGSDDGAGVVLDQEYSRREAPFGFPRVQWIDNYKYWDLYKARPEYFNVDQNTLYRSEVAGSKRAAEIVSATYLRGDVSFLDRRLKIVGGIRAEQTNVEAEGPLTDPTGNYRRDGTGNVVFQRDASGNLILGANRQPLPVLIEPTAINGASNALAVSRLTFVDRGQRAEKEYLRLFPSINASYNVRENLVARAALYTSIGRPNYNQYAGGVTLPDTELAADSVSNRITVNNAGIKAWSATTAKVRIEYYFERVGQVSIGAFRRDFENFFGNVTFPATPEFLSLYGLNPDVYGDFPVATQYNIPSSVRMEGVEFDYKQALTFLPDWARGIQVFANASATRATGAAAENFAGYTPRLYNWGVSLTRPKFNVRVNWNYKGRQRRGLVAAGRSIELGTYDWGSKKLYVDVGAEYSLAKRVVLFASLRNIRDTPDDIERAGPSTPADAQLRQRGRYGALWTFGLKGTF
jgi:TonB-dependent receptor